jgi:putative addiction module component (TIGR02574 family)
MHPQMEALRSLPPSEKLQLVGELWDDLTSIPTPEWHLEEIRSRAAELDRDPSIAITQEEMWRRVDQARGA